MNLKFVEKAEGADDIISMAKKLKTKADWVEQELTKAQLRLNKRLKYPVLNSKENAQIKYIDDLQDISEEVNRQKRAEEHSKTLKYTAGAVGLGLLGNEYIKSKSKLTKQAGFLGLLSGADKARVLAEYEKAKKATETIENSHVDKLMRYLKSEKDLNTLVGKVNEEYKLDKKTKEVENAAKKILNDISTNTNYARAGAGVVGAAGVGAAGYGIGKQAGAVEINKVLQEIEHFGTPTQRKALRDILNSRSAIKAVGIDMPKVYSGSRVATTAVAAGAAGYAGHKLLTKKASKLGKVVKDVKRVSKYFTGKNTLLAEKSLEKAKVGLSKARKELEDVSKVAPEYENALKAVNKAHDRHSKALSLVKDVRKKSKRAVYGTLAGLGAVGVGAGVINSA